MDLSLRDLERAVSIRRQIDGLQKQLSAIMGGKAGNTAEAVDGRRRRHLSAGSAGQDRSSSKSSLGESEKRK